MSLRELPVVALLLAATIAHAAEPCKETLEFADNGSIAQWEVCHDGVTQSFARPGSDRFRLNLSISEVPLEGLLWQRDKVDESGASFKALDSRHSVEIRRTYRQGAGGSLVHTVAVRNLTADPMPVTLIIGPGPSLRTRSGTSRSLADFVYGFERADIGAMKDRWQTATDGSESHRFAITARHKSLVVEASEAFGIRAAREVRAAESATISSKEWLLVLDMERIPPYGIRTLQQKISALATETPVLAAAGYGRLMYSDLWLPLAVLCKWTERAFAGLSRIAGGPGLAVVMLAIVIRFVTLPVGIWSARRQREFIVAEGRIKPQIAKVRANFKGAEQSERILAIYRENQMSPFSGLKGSVGLFVQIPFLLAVFNVTTVSSLFAGESFLWIEDLSLPDTAAMLPASIPLLGNYLNALPIMLGVVNVFSLKGQAGGSTGLKATPVIVTLLIVFAFYSFAAAVVLYWLTVNLLQVGERVMFRHAGGESEKVHQGNS